MDLSSLQKLAEAGPFVFVATILAGLLVGLAFAFVKGWMVPGWIHQREIKRGDDLQAAIPALTDAVKASTAALTKSMDDLADDVRWDQRDRNDARRTARDAAS